MKKVRKRTSKGMKDSDRDPDAELAGLRLRLEEAEETLRAIREGEVDAVIVSGSRGDRVFSLTESENMHRLMVETMSEVALASTLDGTIVYSNGSLCDLLLLTPGQTLGRSIFQFVIEQDREDLCTLILRAQTEKAVARLEFQRSDGALVSFHMSATVLDRPEGPLVCFVGTDLRRIEADREMIQQLNEQRELLAASEQRFRSVLENSLDVNYRLNLITDRYDYMSPSSTDVVGYTPDELLKMSGTAIAKLFHPDDMPILQEALAQLEKTGTMRAEYRFQVKDGTYRWLSNTMSLIRDFEGNPLYRGGTIRDITESKRKEEMLNRLYEEARLNAVVKTELLNEVNHRVKNNLMIIHGLILAEKRQAIRQGHGEAEALSEKFEGRIQGLLEIHQMLSDSGWEPVKISHLADRICKSVLHSFSNGQLVVDLFVGECAITVNSRQAGSLALVFNELVINCMKYAFASAEGGETPAITIEFAHEEECLRIAFRDNGCGYPESVLKDHRWNVGLRLVHQIIEHTLGGEILLLNSNGALAQIVIDLDEANQ